MSYRKSLIGLSLFLVAAIVTTSMVFVTLRRDVSGPTNTYTAMFTDVSGLHPGDDVRIAGVRVGRVDSIDLDGTLAKVTFRIAKDQECRSDICQCHDLVVAAELAIRGDCVLVGSTESQRLLQVKARVNEGAHEAQRLAHKAVGQR